MSEGFEALWLGIQLLVGYSGGLTRKGVRAAPPWLLARNHRLQSYPKERNPDNELSECGFGFSYKDTSES